MCDDFKIVFSDASDESAFLKQPIVYNKYVKLHSKPPDLFSESKEETDISNVSKSTKELMQQQIPKQKYPYNYNPHVEPDLLADLWTIVRGFRNGFIYGMKIRLPHAFVMTMLFNRKEYVN